MKKILFLVIIFFTGHFILAQGNSIDSLQNTIKTLPSPNIELKDDSKIILENELKDLLKATTNYLKKQEEGESILRIFPDWFKTLGEGILALLSILGIIVGAYRSSKSKLSIEALSKGIAETINTQKNNYLLISIGIICISAILFKDIFLLVLLAFTILTILLLGSLFLLYKYLSYAHSAGIINLKSYFPVEKEESNDFDDLQRIFNRIHIWLQEFHISKIELDLSIIDGFDKVLIEFQHSKTDNKKQDSKHFTFLDRVFVMSKSKKVQLKSINKDGLVSGEIEKSLVGYKLIEFSIPILEKMTNYLIQHKIYGELAHIVDEPKKGK